MTMAARIEGARVAVLAGGRLMDEDSYALSKLARTVFRTNDIDHRRGAPAPAAERRAARRPMEVTYRDVERAPAILVAGLDAEQEVPILHLRLRKAAAAGARIWVLHPRRTRLHDVAVHVLASPGDESRLLAGGADPLLDEALEALRAAGRDGIVIAGERPGVADASLAAADEAGARFVYVTRRAGDRGALRAGVHPSLLPGGRSPDEAGGLENSWGELERRMPGRDWRGILEACAAREVDVLYLIGVDPLRDYPDARLARRAMENVPVKIVQSLELGALEPFADAFLPAAAFLEKDGHVSTWEGRGQRLRPVRDPEGLSRPDWEIFASFALACGGDLGFETLDELHREMGEVLAPRDDAGTPGADTPDTGSPASPTEGVTLFTYPLLVDDGRLSERADELKATLADEPFVEIHPEDAAASNVADGQRVLLTTAAGEATLAARVTAHIAKGCVFVPFNQPGFPANTLLDGSFVTATSVEPVEQLAAAGAES
jgi:NADH-quinone oxidoreductase subunit G